MSGTLSWRYKMTAIEVECRVSWANAALRYWNAEEDNIDRVRVYWHHAHQRLCNYAGSRGMKFLNA